MTPASLSRRLALLAALASSVLVAACGGGGGDGDAGTTTVRALNLTSDLPSVDLYIGETKQFGALATDVVAPSQSFAANTYTLNVKKAGDGATLLTGSYALSKDKHFTAIVWGRENALRLSTLPEDENTADIAAGNSRVRFFNATTDTGSLDVYFTTTDAVLADSSPSQGLLTAGSLSGFRDLSKGTYRLRVTGAGNPRDVRLDIPAVTLAEQKYATLVLTAGGGGVLVNGSLIEQQGTVTALKSGKTRVRVVASVAGAGVVNATLGGTTTLAGALRSPVVGVYNVVNAGNQELVVRVNGTVISTTTPNLISGADYTLLVYGTAAAPALVVLNDDNRLPNVSTRAKLRLVNGVAGSDPLGMSLDFFSEADNIVAGRASEYTVVNAAGSNLLQVISPSTGELFSRQAATGTNLLQAQGVYTVFLLDGVATPSGTLSRDR